MLLIPFERIKLHSPYNADLVLQKLEDSIEPRRLFAWWSGKHRPYRGRIQGDTFAVSRIIHYRNSFLPQIKGRVDRTFPGCSVTITMSLHPLVMVFVGLWIGGVGLMGAIRISPLLQAATELKDFLPTAITGVAIPFAFIIFAYAIALIGFKLESSKSRSFFAALFEADRIEEASLQELVWGA